MCGVVFGSAQEAVRWLLDSRDMLGLMPTMSGRFASLGPIDQLGIDGSGRAFGSGYDDLAIARTDLTHMIRDLPRPHRDVIIDCLIPAGCLRRDAADIYRSTRGVSRRAGYAAVERAVGALEAAMARGGYLDDRPRLPRVCCAADLDLGASPATTQAPTQAEECGAA